MIDVPVGTGPADAAVDVESLVKRYGARTVLDGVSLSARRGEIVAVLGPNGAGKTTTVEIIEGYRRADTGRVRVLGRDPAQGGRAHRARVGLMLQGGGIDPRAQPRETLRQYGRFHATPRDPDELLDLVGLQSVATTRYRRLSGGERQRLGLALALVGRPEVLILDEPTAGMDPEARARTRTIVTDARDAGLAILLTSHDLADVERLADRIVILAAGRVVASGTPGELMASTAQAVTFRLAQVIGAGERRALAAALSAAGRNASVATVGDDGRYRIDGVPPDPGVIAALAAWCAASDRLLLEVRSTGGTLEDAYLALAGSASEDGP